MKRGYKTPGSGRVKGTPNKKTAELAEIAERLKCHPFEALLRLAVYYDPTRRGGAKAKDGVAAGRLYGEACGYLYPKRKAIEVTPGASNGDFTLEELLATYRRASDGSGSAV